MHRFSCLDEKQKKAIINPVNDEHKNKGPPKSGKIFQNLHIIAGINTSPKKINKGLALLSGIVMMLTNNEIKDII